MCQLCLKIHYIPKDEGFIIGPFSAWKKKEDEYHNMVFQSHIEDADSQIYFDPCFESSLSVRL